MELDASETERRQLAYSTQFFEFTPDAFVDAVAGPSYEAINEYLDVSETNIRNSKLFILRNSAIFTRKFQL